jgi:hypothetical protein
MVLRVCLTEDCNESGKIPIPLGRFNRREKQACDKLSRNTQDASLE